MPTYIGVDLAWKSQNNPSGLAVLESDQSGAELIANATIGAEFDVSSTLLHFVKPDCIVAIDAPLIINNLTGQRQCETEVGRRYGARHASCHTSNLSLYPSASSVVLTSRLSSHGFKHVNPGDRNLNGRLMMEVYPHAAMVALWDLPRIIKYKKGSYSN